MLDVITARLLDWYSFALLILIIGSILSVANFMRQERRNADTENLSVGNLIRIALDKAPEGKFSVLILMGSGYSLYCKVLGLSRHDALNPISLLLHFGGTVFFAFLLACAVLISRWINFDNSQQ